MGEGEEEEIEEKAMVRFTRTQQNKHESLQ